MYNDVQYYTCKLQCYRPGKELVCADKCVKTLRII